MEKLTGVTAVLLEANYAILLYLIILEFCVLTLMSLYNASSCVLHFVRHYFVH